MTLYQTLATIVALVTCVICLVGLAFDKRVGGLYFWRVGRLGGSLYWSRRHNPVTDSILTFCYSLAAVLALAVIGICLMTPPAQSAETAESKLREFAAICPIPEKLHPAAIIGITAGLQGELSPTDSMRYVGLVNSDNIPLAECLFMFLTSEGI